MSPTFTSALPSRSRGGSSVPPLLRRGLRPMLVLPQLGPPARPPTPHPIDAVRVEGGGPVPREVRQPPTIRIHARDGSRRGGQERGTRAPRARRGPAHAPRAFPGSPGERPGDRPRRNGIHLGGPAEGRS